MLTFVPTEKDTTSANWLVKMYISHMVNCIPSSEITRKVCTLNWSNCSSIRTDLSRRQIEWPDSWSSLPLTSFTASPGLWLPTLSSQAANSISTSLRAPLLSSSPLSPSHMACGHVPHFSDNFSSERIGLKQEKDVSPPSYSHRAQFGEWNSHY